MENEKAIRQSEQEEQKRYGAVPSSSGGAAWNASNIDDPSSQNAPQDIDELKEKEQVQKVDQVSPSMPPNKPAPPPNSAEGTRLT